MKIKNLQTSKKVEFSSIASGEIFHYDPNAFPSHYMKIIATKDGTNAVDITTGKPYTFEKGTLVTKVDGSFVVQSDSGPGGESGNDQLTRNLQIPWTPSK